MEQPRNSRMPQNRCEWSIVGARRGQAAMEYLMTHAWAIVALMVVGVALWHMGIFNMGDSQYTSSGFGCIKPLLANAEMSEDGKEFSVLFSNMCGKQIVLTDALAIRDDPSAINPSCGSAYCSINVTFKDSDEEKMLRSPWSVHAICNDPATGGCYVCAGNATVNPETIQNGEVFLLKFSDVCEAMHPTPQSSHFRVRITLYYLIYLNEFYERTSQGIIEGEYN